MRQVSITAVEAVQKPSISSAELFLEAEAYLERLRSSSEPLNLSVAEQHRLAELFEVALGRLDRAEAIAGIRLGLEQSEQGLGRDAREVFAELRRKHNIPDTR